MEQHELNEIMIEWEEDIKLNTMVNEIFEQLKGREN